MINTIRSIGCLIVFGLCFAGDAWGITLTECIDKARENYPLILQYDLLSTTTDVELNEVNNGWLPRIGVYGQITGQNIVPSFPETLTGMLDKMGQSMKGLGKLQYKVGADVSQTIWDGGASKAKREVIRSSENVKRSALDVEMYGVRQRVENLYFAILLLQEQIEQQNVTKELLDANLKKVRSMLTNGVAMQCDADMIEAQLLSVNQGITLANSAMCGYKSTLGLFVGEDVTKEKFVVPASSMPNSVESDRPELKLFDSRIEANWKSDLLKKSSLMPKIGFFAQAYYGYPGFNYFQSMMNRDLSFNILAGVKVQWNIDSFYSRKNDIRKIENDNRILNTERDVFLFNSRLQSESEIMAIKGLREVAKEDNKIIKLRQDVRKAAESQLENGVIDVTVLLNKISEENIASLNGKLHELQLLQEIYKLKYTLNR